MITIYLYKKSNSIFIGSDTGVIDNVVNDLMEDYDFTLTPPPTLTKDWRWDGLKWVEYVPPLPPLEERQAAAWQGIKNMRQQVIEAGAYVKSVNKIFQTDEASINQYNNIGNMIILGNYEPVDWKVHDNSWVTLTVDLYKELQAAILAKTNRAFQAAEQHKAAMLQLENPEDYDYSENWI